MRSGATLEVVAAISRRGQVADRASVWVEFYGPGQLPGHRPFKVARAEFDPKSRRWVALVPSRGWPAGTWRYRVVAEAATVAEEKNLRGGSAEFTFDLAA